MLILKNGEYVLDNEEQVISEIEIPYEEKVVSLIRQRYSLDEELAIQRQRYETRRIQRILCIL